MFAGMRLTQPFEHEADAGSINIGDTREIDLDVPVADERLAFGQQSTNMVSGDVSTDQPAILL